VDEALPVQYIHILKSPEVEFLDVIGTKVLRVFLLAISQSHLLAVFNLTPPPRQKLFETGL
jgi:hypothetical protein